MKSINQDSLENTFGWFRNNSGCNVHPDLMQFGYLLGKLLSYTLLEHNTGANCIKDNELILELNTGTEEEEKEFVPISKEYKKVKCDDGVVRY